MSSNEKLPPGGIGSVDLPKGLSAVKNAHRAGGNRSLIMIFVNSDRCRLGLSYAAPCFYSVFFKEGATGLSGKSHKEYNGQR